MLEAVSKPQGHRALLRSRHGGIAQVATCVPIKATDVDAMVTWAKEQAVDLVMVAPDDPLALGMVDALEAEGIPAFGPPEKRRHHRG